MASTELENTFDLDVLLSKARIQYSQVNIAYKDESNFMKIIGKLMFFNKDFMTHYITTIGNTVYYPSRDFVKNNRVDAYMTFLHELVHVHDSKKYSHFLFSLAYLLPQLLFLLVIPLLFIFGWKALLCSLFLLPLPAYFRMNFEKRAYTISIYVIKRIIDKYNIKLDLNQFAKAYALEFKKSTYYYSWPFSGLQDYFAGLTDRFNKGELPTCELEVYKSIDQILD